MSGDVYAGYVDIPVGTIWLMVVLIYALIVGGNFLWELFNDVLEHCLQPKQVHMLLMLQRLYKELTVAGLLSLGVFLLTVSGALDEETKHAFEFVHIALFVLVIFYILTVVFVAVLNILIFRRWANLEHSIFDEVNSERAALTEKNAERSFIFTMFDFHGYYRRYYLAQAHAYHSIREHFIEQHELPYFFQLNKYLKRCVKGLFIEFASIHWSVVFIVVTALLMMWLPFALTLEEMFLGIPLLLGQLLINAGCFLVYWKTHSIWNKLKSDKKLMIKPQKPVPMAPIAAGTFIARELEKEMGMVQQIAMPDRPDTHTNTALSDSGSGSTSATSASGSGSSASSSPTTSDFEKRVPRLRLHKRRYAPHVTRSAEEDDESQSESDSTISNSEKPSSRKRSARKSKDDATTSEQEPEDLKIPLSSSSSSVTTSPMPEEIDGNESDSELDSEAERRRTSQRKQRLRQRRQNSAQRSLTKATRGLSNQPTPRDHKPPQRHSHNAETSHKHSNRRHHAKSRAIVETDSDTDSVSAASFPTAINIPALLLIPPATEDIPNAYRVKEKKNRWRAYGGNKKTKPKYGQRKPDPATFQSHHGNHGAHPEVAMYSVYNTHHQTDLQWITNFLWPLLTCRLSLREVWHKLALRKKGGTKHQSLFWFGRPNWLQYLIQVILFFQSAEAALVTGFASGVIGNLPLYIRFLAIPFVFLNLFILLPAIIYNFAIIVNVGEYTKRELLEGLLHKHGLHPTQALIMTSATLPASRYPHAKAASLGQDLEEGVLRRLTRLKEVVMQSPSTSEDDKQPAVSRPNLRNSHFNPTSVRNSRRPYYYSSDTSDTNTNTNTSTNKKTRAPNSSSSSGSSSPYGMDASRLHSLLHHVANAT